MFRQVHAAAAALYRSAASRPTALTLMRRCASAPVTPRALFSSSGATRAAGAHLASATPIALESARATTTGFLSALSLKSASFTVLRARGVTYVDKTSAVADLLVSEEAMSAFFSRPRKFGKSLTLDVAAEMLAAGALPTGVAPWPGYAPVDVDAVFGGLAVHKRLRSGDQSLRGLLKRSHFVVKLGLGDAQTGTELKGAIFDGLADIAHHAFGPALKSEVRAASTAAGAVRALLSAVPRGVPVALLVDEYDGAIIQDVSKGRWAAADDGLAALRSLLMSTKAPDVGSRIERCLVTGVARFAHTSLFSGANNFTDLTDDPLLSRVLGFSEAEIRDNFSAELERLGVALKTDRDGAVAELARWYNGYSFDGSSSCFNPYPVLAALRAGSITERELDGASGIDWLSLTPGDVIFGLAKELKGNMLTTAARVDIADLKARRVRVVPLLLQTGLLSLVAGQPTQCRAPNEYARRSLQLMVSSALEMKPEELAPLAASLRTRDRAAFATFAEFLFSRIPRTLFKGDRGGAVELREAVFQAALCAAILAMKVPFVTADIEASSLAGRTDILVRFSGAAPAEAWLIDIALGTNAMAKLGQVQTFAQALSEPTVYCCTIHVQAGEGTESASVSADAALVTAAWSVRKDGVWAAA
jgi:hypothetical protein